MKVRIQVEAEELLSYKYRLNSTEVFPTSLSSLLGNGYSGLKGSGSDLYGIREYQHGDNYKRVNRQATARTGIIHLNEYLEDRLLSAYLLIDQSSPLFFSSTYVMKSVIAARRGAETLFSYLKNGHRVSGDVFNEHAYATLPLTSSEITSEEWIMQVAKFNQMLLCKQKISKGNALSEALARALEAGISGRELYVFSDFMFYKGAELMDLLTTLRGNNRIYLIQVTDQLEENPPLKQWLSNGTNEFILRSEEEREKYKTLRETKKQRIMSFSRQNDIVFTEFFT